GERGETNPRLLGGSADDEAMPKSSSRKGPARIKTDPFADDEEVTPRTGKARGTSPPDDEETDLAEDVTPPARLPRSGAGSRPRSLAGISVDDESDAGLDDIPAINRSAPRSKKIVDSDPAEDSSDASKSVKDNLGLSTDASAERRPARPLNTI